MVLENPIIQLKENLLVTPSGDVWAYYKIHAENIAEGNQSQEEEKKEAIFHTLQNLSSCEDVHFSLVPENLDLRQRFSELENDYSTDAFNIAQYYAKETVSKLENEMRVITRPAFYMGVKVRSVESVESLKEGFKNVLDILAKRFFEMNGYEIVMSDSDWKMIEELEKEIFSNVKNLNATRITEEENIYLNRSQYIRGSKHDVKFESSINHIKSITDSIIDPREKGYLKIESANGSNYTSMIVVDEFPPNMGYTHIFKIADKFKFPVELNIKVRFERTEGEFGMKAKFEGKRKRFRVKAKENISMQDTEGNRSKLNRALVKAGVDELEAGHTMLSWLTVFTVTGRTKEECKRRSDSVIQYLKNMKIKAYRPTNNQVELFYMILNGSSIVNYTKWIQTTSTETFGENLFGVANTVGNNVGWVIGRINQMQYANSPKEAILASKKLVLWNQIASNKNIKGSITASPHIAITGETGKGKSFLTKILFFYMTLMNSRVLYIDPKMEFRKEIEGILNNPKLVKKYPKYVELIKQYHYISLNVSDKKNYGALDPIVFLKATDGAKDTAKAMLKEILERDYTVPVELAINNAIDSVIQRRSNGEQVGMLHVIENLKQSPDEEISDMGKLFESKVTNTILELGFSNGETQGINLDNRINILEIAGLELPSSESDNLTEINRQSIALMLPLGKFCEKFGADDKKLFSVEFFDEAWIFQKSKEGAVILEKMKRVGRSYNNTLVYTTQSVNDVDSGEGGQFGQVFAFDSRSERKEILKHLDIEVNDRNIKRLATSTQGQCFYRDIYNHTDMITVDSMFDELMITGKTVDINESAKAEEKYA